MKAAGRILGGFPACRMADGVGAWNRLKLLI
jgi:hypothetical protein